MSDPREHSQPITFFAFLFFACSLLCGVADAAPSIALSKKSGPPTSKILVSGRGFEPNVGVDIFFGTKDEVLVVTNGKGEFHSARAYAPRYARPGQHWVTALERNNDKGAQEPFLVQTDWAQFGFDPSLSGLNPYENVLDKNNVSDLDLAWTYTLSTNYDQFSNPAVWEGVVYVAFGGGSLYALDAETGAVLWTYAGPWGSPAVRNGVVYTQDGNAEALDARTGALLWTFTMEGSVLLGVDPPTVDHDRVFFGDGYRALYALNAATGAFLWMFPFGYQGGMASAPAVANGVVYACVGYANFGAGACYALDEKTGGLLWQYSVTQGPIFGSPTVAQGLVFFEEQYQGIFALDASSGALVWQYSPSGSFASPAVADGTVFVGGDGGLLALEASTGKLLWQATDGGVTSVAIANGLVYGCVGGHSVEARDANTGILLWSYPIGNGSIYGPAVANGWVFAPSLSSDNGVFTQVLAFRLKHSFAEERSSVNRPGFSNLRPDSSLQVSRPNSAPRGVKLRRLPG